MTTQGNPPQLEHLEGLALEYARIPHWRDRMLGRFHPAKRRRLAARARQGLRFAGRMIYTEGSLRSQFFYAHPTQYAGQHADCSQYGAGCAHRVGVKRVNGSDYTGTLWDKGKVIPAPRIGCFVIFGAFPGVHLGIVTGRVAGNSLVTGFGSQRGPDLNTLGALLGYFDRIGHPGARFIDITRRP